MNELDKLREMLNNAGIEYEDYVEKWEDQPHYEFVKESMEKVMPMYGEVGKYSRNQVIYRAVKDKLGWKIDGICQYGSYGAKEGLIETYGPLGVDKQGQPRVMTAQEMFDIIKEDYDTCKLK